MDNIFEWIIKIIIFPFLLAPYLLAMVLLVAYIIGKVIGSLILGDPLPKYKLFTFKDFLESVGDLYD